MKPKSKNSSFAKVLFAGHGHNVFEFGQRHGVIVRLFCGSASGLQLARVALQVPEALQQQERRAHKQRRAELLVQIKTPPYL